MLVGADLLEEFVDHDGVEADDDEEWQEVTKHKEQRLKYINITYIQRL